MKTNEMALSAGYSLLNASFDRFLFASIGEEENGMPLSVASALARLGRDPWVEAGRLAKLPRETATEALVAMIARMSPARVNPSDAAVIAARLILLLPSGVSSPSVAQAGRADPSRGWFNRLIVLLCLALLAFASFNLFVDRGAPSDAPHAVGATSTP
jgi:hypothetical protein